MPSWRLVTGSFLMVTATLVAVVGIAYARKDIPEDLNAFATQQDTVYYWAGGIPMARTGYGNAARKCPCRRSPTTSDGPCRRPRTPTSTRTTAYRRSESPARCGARQRRGDPGRIDHHVSRTEAASQAEGSTEGDPAQYEKWRKEARNAYVAGFERVFHGSRAPLFIGNHFEDWNGGIYMDAAEETMREVCRARRCAVCPSAN